MACNSIGGDMDRLRSKLEMKVNIVKYDMREFNLIVEEIISEIEAKSKRLDLSTRINEKHGDELIRQLESLHSKVVDFKLEIRKLNLLKMQNVNGEMDSTVHSFKKKLTFSPLEKCEASKYGETTFEIDSSPDSGDEVSRFLEKRAECRGINREYDSALNGNICNQESLNMETENDDYDYEADVKWVDNLFKLDEDVCVGASKSSIASSKIVDNCSESTSGVHTVDGARSLASVSQMSSQESEKINKIPRVPVGTMVYVSPAYIINPSLFWLHYNPKLNDDILTKLQRSQNMLFRTDAWRIKEFRRNMFVAALYSKDGFWYRAQILNVVGRDSSSKLQVEVRYIDYGNTEILTEDDVTILSPDFLRYEPQAVRCCLTHISESAEWSKEIIDLFRTTIEGSKALTAYFFAGIPCKNGDLIFSVEIFDDSKSFMDILPNPRSN